MEVKGLDISVYQKGISFDAIKSSVEFVILRAGFTGWGGDGTNKNKDACFEDFYKQAKERVDLCQVFRHIFMDKLLIRI